MAEYREPSIPGQIKHYRVLEEIGRGGMGVIYRAVDTALERVVALKVLHEELRMQPELVARFRREAQAAARLNHPNIVQIYSIGTSGDDLPYIAMEYIDGVPLSIVMQRAGRLPWQKALDYAEQVAEALSCAHEAQIIHRDIKPSNILIDKQDQAFVTDFGIAKILTVEEQLTVDGTHLGTPQYMAPERCQRGTVTTASDIYSLGVLLFQMIAGRLPFDASSATDLVRQILSESPPRLRTLVPNVPESVERLVAYLIEKRPADRPASADDVCEAISLVRQGRPLDELRLTMASALDDFRMADKSGLSFGKTDATTKLLLTNSPVANFTLHWFGTPQPWKVIAAALVLVVAGAGLGKLVAKGLEEEPWAIAARQLAGDVTRWSAPGAVANWVRGTPGVTYARLQFPGMAVSGIVPAHDGVYVQLDGVAGTFRERQRLVCYLSPERQTASVTVPPSGPTGTAAGCNALCVLGSGTDAGPHEPLLVRYSVPSLAPQKERVHLLTCSPVAVDELPDSVFGGSSPAGPQVPEGLRLADVTAAAMRPGTGVLALALRHPTSPQNYIAETVRESGGAWGLRALTNYGHPVELIQYDRQGTHLVYTREENPTHIEVWAIDLSSPARDGTQLIAGPLTVTRNLVNAEGTLAAVSKKAPGQSSEVLAVPIADEAQPLELGPGSWPAWHPMRNLVVVAAADATGRRQLFAVQAAAPYRRQQLTLVDEGAVSGPVAVTGDGAWAVARLRRASGEPELVCVSLENVDF